MEDDKSKEVSDNSESSEDQSKDLGDTLYPDTPEGGEAPENSENSESVNDNEESGEENVEDDGHLGVEDSEDDKKEESKDDSDEKESDDDKSDAPDDYKLQLSEESLLADESIDKVAEFAKENKLPQEAAEKTLKLMDDAVEEYQKFLEETAEERAEEQIKAQKNKWLEESKNDDVIGGDNFNRYVASGNRVINTFADQEFKNLLKRSGIGNHKTFIKFVGNIGMKNLDDDIDLGGESSEKDQELKDTLYPTMK